MKERESSIIKPAQMSLQVGTFHSREHEEKYMISCQDDGLQQSLPEDFDIRIRMEVWQI